MIEIVVPLQDCVRSYLVFGIEQGAISESQVLCRSPCSSGEEVLVMGLIAFFTFTRGSGCQAIYFSLSSLLRCGGPPVIAALGLQRKWRLPIV